MRDLTNDLYIELMRRNIDQFKYALIENWKLKKLTSKSVSNSWIDDVYNKALSFGAEAGKVLGAGGGGFLMVYVPFEKQDYFKEKMKEWKIFKFGIDHIGSRII